MIFCARVLRILRISLFASVLLLSIIRLFLACFMFVVGRRAAILDV